MIRNDFNRVRHDKRLARRLFRAKNEDGFGNIIHRLIQIRFSKSVSIIQFDTVGVSNTPKFWAINKGATLNFLDAFFQSHFFQIRTFRKSPRRNGFDRAGNYDGGQVLVALKEIKINFFHAGWNNHFAPYGFCGLPVDDIVPAMFVIFVGLVKIVTTLVNIITVVATRIVIFDFADMNVGYLVNGIADAVFGVYRIAINRISGNRGLSLF